MAANCLIPYMDNEHELTEKRNVIKRKGKKCVEYTLAVSRFSKSKMILNKGRKGFFLFNMESMKEMGLTTLVQI